MRYFLMVLAIVVASFGHTQSASAQACTGFALLKDGDQYVDMGGGRALVDNRCYERALCIGGTISNLGDNLFGCFVVPPCEGSVELVKDGQATQTEDGHWTRADDERTYCEASCPTGQTLEQVSEDGFQCKSPEPVCSGVGNLKSGEQIWKRAENMWKTRDGKTTYCSVTCPAGTTLTKVRGDTRVCKPDPINCQALRDQYNVIPDQAWGSMPADVRETWTANSCGEKVKTVNCQFMSSHYGIVAGKTFNNAPRHVRGHWNRLNCGPVTTCEGVGNLKSGDKIWKRGENMWKTKDGKNTYCSVTCPANTTLTKTDRDTHTCKPNPPVCNGVLEMKSGQKIWKRASNMWKTRNGENTYCSVKCPAGTKLTDIRGDAYICKPEAPECSGVGTLKVDQKIWKRAEKKWITKDGKNTYCSVKCPAGSTLKNAHGDTFICEANKAACKGVGNLKSGEQIWKRAANMWKTKDGKNTYCSVKCPAGTKLTQVRGDTHVCKPNPVNCQALRDKYNVIPGRAWGSMPTAVRETWIANSCNEKVKTVNCQFMSSHYGIVAGKTFNNAPRHVRGHWNRLNCGPVTTCEGVGNLKSGDKIWKRGENMWKTKDGKNTYCSVKCPANTTLTKTDRDTHTCKPNAPVCNGVGNLKSGEQIWKRAANMWKTKDGKNTYCSVKCPAGTKLTHVRGDTHICKSEAADCKGVGTLKVDQKIWKRAEKKWITKDGKNTYCSVKCPAGSTLKRAHGDTFICEANKAACKGVGNLKVGDKIWKKASNMWKTKDGKNTYCSVKCPAGTKLTLESGDTHFCKPNDVKGCVGELKRNGVRVKKIANERESFKLEHDSWVFYGANNCFNRKDFKAGTTVQCGNATFKDPLHGVEKACWFRKK